MKKICNLSFAILLAMGSSGVFADNTTGSGSDSAAGRSKLNNGATGARGGDAGTAGTSPSTSNAPSSTGQTGDGPPSTGYGNTDPKAIEGTTSIGTGVGSSPNGVGPKKGSIRNGESGAGTGTGGK